MRDGWRESRFDAFLSEIARPVAVSSLDVVRYAGVRWYNEGVYAREPVPAAEVKTRTLTELRAGDVTYNRMWATKASFGVAGEDVDGCHVTNDFPIFEVDTSETSAAFVKLLFETPRFQMEAADRATGTTERRRLKQRDFLSIPATLPPRDEQRRIVDLVEAADDAVAAAEAEELGATSLLAEILDATAHGETAAIGSLASIVSGASWGKGDVRKDAGDGVTSVLTIANTKPDGSISGETTLVHGLSTKVARLTASSLVVIRTNGNHNRIGNVYRVPEEHVGAAVSAFQFVVRPIEPEDSDYLYWMMSAPSFQAAVTAEASGSTGLGNIAAGKLREMQVPWPADPEARTARATTFARFAEVANTARETAVALRTLRSNLMTVLLSGEHEIPASYDALLEAENA
jgi:type I restriction enzyme S subunit